MLGAQKGPESIVIGNESSTIYTTFRQSFGNVQPRGSIFILAFQIYTHLTSHDNIVTGVTNLY